MRAYAVKSIAAFIIEDLGLADPPRNSRRVPVVGDIPTALQRIWLWRGGSCWGGYDLTSTDTAVNNRNLCIAPAYFSPGQVSRHLVRSLTPILSSSQTRATSSARISKLSRTCLCRRSLASQWRLFARYLTRHQDLLPFELLHTAEDMVAVIESAIVWGYNLLNRISCSNGLISNWWTLPIGNAWPWASGAKNGLRCSNSATDAGAYGVCAPALHCF